MATVPRPQQYYEGATTPDPASLGLIVSPFGTVRSCSFVLSLTRSRCRAGRHQARIGSKPVIPADLSCHTDGTGSPRFPGKPSRGSAIVPKTPAGPWRLVSDGASGAAPTFWTMKAPALVISGLNVRRFATNCVRFTMDVADHHVTLVSGWRTAPLPGGSRTRWLAMKGF